MNQNADSDTSGNINNGRYGDNTNANDVNPFMQTGNEFSFADLAQRAERVDPRGQPRQCEHLHDRSARAGRRAGPRPECRHDGLPDYVRTSQDSLRVLAEQTGGFATVNQNDFVKSLKRIDAETSDYYVIGYYSSNPDPTMRKRKVEVKVNRPNLELRYRTEYTLKPTKAPVAKPSSTSSKPKTPQQD